VTPDSSGSFALSFQETSDVHWYATQSFHTTATGSTDVASLHCTVSGALFGYAEPSDGPDRQTDIAADDEHGDLAGTTFDGAEALSLFRATNGHMTRLETFTYDGVGISPMESVLAVGVTPTEVVASVQRTDSSIGQYRDVGFVFRPGGRVQLGQSASWSGVEPSGVAPDGTIVGEAHIASGPNAGRWAVLTWATPGSPFHVVATALTDQPTPVIDADDTVVYDSASGARVVRRDGSTAVLEAPDGGPSNDSSLAAAGTTIYGTSDSDQILAWLPDATGASALTGVAVIDDYQVQTPVAADAAGQVVVSGDSNQTSLFSPSRGVVELHAPSRSGYPTDDVLDGPGTAIFTAPADLLPHRETCS
jgi:hypothetical protein